MCSLRYAGRVASMRTDPVVVLISIRSPHVDNLFAGSKSFELRRRWAVPAGAIALIYAAGARRELAGSFVVGESRRGSPEAVWREVGKETAVDRGEYDRYFEGVDCAIAIPVEELTELGTPVPLDELRQRHPAFRAPQSHRFLTSDEVSQILNGEYDELISR